MGSEGKWITVTLISIISLGGLALTMSIWNSGEPGYGVFIVPVLVAIADILLILIYRIAHSSNSSIPSSSPQQSQGYQPQPFNNPPMTHPSQQYDPYMQKDQYCHACGALLEQGSTFCGNCGARQ